VALLIFRLTGFRVLLQDEATDRTIGFGRAFMAMDVDVEAGVTTESGGQSYWGILVLLIYVVDVCEE